DHLLHFGPDLLQSDAHALQRAGGHTLPLGHQTEQNVFCTYHVMAQATGLFLRENDDLLCPFRKAAKHVITILFLSPAPRPRAGALPSWPETSSPSCRPLAAEPPANQRRPVQVALGGLQL